MTKRGFTVDVNEQICPNKWSYSFDGKSLEITEEFGEDIPADELQEIAERWRRCKHPARTVTLDNGTLHIVTQLPEGIEQEHAVATLAIEGIRQATILNLAGTDTVFTVIDDVTSGLGQAEDKRG